MTRYCLMPHIYGCASEHGAVFLDINNDQYYFFDPVQWSSISPLIEGTPPVPSNSKIICSPSVQIEQVSQLIKLNIITNKYELGKSFRQILPHPPQSSLEQLSIMNEPKFTWRHIIAIFYSGIITLAELHLLPLKKIILRLQALRRRRHRINRSDQDTQKKLIYLARIYDQLRPILPKNRICLYDSLVFYRFCSIYRVYPTIVFGVTMYPFAAHCWVQSGEYILNDYPQNIKRYNPIMSF